MTELSPDDIQLDDAAAEAPQYAGTWEAANVSTTSVVAYAYTGDYRIDCMLDGLDYRWNAGKPLGSAVTVTYSFMTAAPTYGGNVADGMWGFSPFNAAQKAAVRDILGKVQAELGITFQEVSDSATSYGKIRFGNNEQDYSAGYAYYPSTTYAEGGDVWLDSLTPVNLAPTQGNWGYATLVHEIGHALGLKHPGNYNAGTIAVSAPGNYLGTTEDTTDYTVMSYYDAAGGQPRDWYGMYDLLTLKKLYGADAGFNAGNTVHKFTDADGANLSIIDDASGSDTIDLSALSVGAKVDMNPGGFSSVGKDGRSAAVNNVSIDLTTWIEHFTGTAYNDTVSANAGNNRLQLGGGTNVANGQDGIDTAIYAGARGGYTVAKSGGTLTVTGTGARDTLTNVERLEFSNMKLAFDLDGAAGKAAKLLDAVFGIDGVHSEAYVGIGLQWLDSGMAYAAVAKAALDGALGANASNGAVVDLLFHNVCGRAATASEKAYYVGLLQSGAYDKGSLTVMAAEHDQVEWNIDLAGLQQTGLEYV